MTMVLIACGVPGVGKSTTLQYFMEPDVVRLSSDDFIELVAGLNDKTYDQVFSDTIDSANTIFWQMYEQNLKAGTNRIILDRTFVSKKTRKRALDLAKRYKAEVGALSFKLPETDSEHTAWNQRLDRPGKSIPAHVLIDMFCSFVPPHVNEGFSHIEYINTFKDY
jgi:predicted kinase